jgi:hypothetical protein
MSFLYTFAVLTVIMSTFLYYSWAPVWLHGIRSVVWLMPGVLDGGGGGPFQTGTLWFWRVVFAFIRRLHPRYLFFGPRADCDSSNSWSRVLHYREWSSSTRLMCNSESEVFTFFNQARPQLISLMVSDETGWESGGTRKPPVYLMHMF